MKFARSIRVLAGTAAVVSMNLLASSHVHAATWLGNTADLHTAGNWSPVGVPGNGDVVTFDGTGINNNPTFAAAFQGAGAGIGLMTLTAGQTSPLTITNTGAAGIVFRLAGTTGNSGIVVDAGAGALTFGGSGSAMIINMGGASGTSTFINNSVNPVTFASNANLGRGASTNQVAAFSGSGTWVLDGAIDHTGGGSVSVTKSGTGTLIFNNNNQYGGATTLTEGVLRVTHNLGFGSGGVVTNGGVLELLNNGAGNDGVINYDSTALTTNSGNTATYFVGNNGANTGNTIQMGGSYNLGNATMNVTGANDYRLGITTMTTGGGNAGTAIINPTTANVTIGSIANGTFTRTLQLGGTSDDNIVTGVITNGSGVMTINKIGTSTWTFEEANTYTGNTTVSGGTLLLNNASGSGLGTGNAVVNATGTLGGTGGFTGNATINANGALAPGGNGVIESLATGNLTFANNAIYNYDYLAGSGDLTEVTGNLLFGANLTLNLNSLDGYVHAGNYVLFTYTGADPTLPNFDINFVNGGGIASVFVNADTNEVILALSVPEPATAALGVIGLASLMLRRRRTV